MHDGGKMTATLLRFSLLASLAAGASTGYTAPTFVNGLALPGGLLDIKHGKSADSGLRVGYFSDIYYDRNLERMVGTLRPRSRGWCARLWHAGAALHAQH